eukprot:scaffold2963_cov250-Pinguiococcus_pyrenoidosus.AAC.24
MVDGEGMLRSTALQTNGHSFPPLHKRAPHCASLRLRTVVVGDVHDAEHRDVSAVPFLPPVAFPSFFLEDDLLRIASLLLAEQGHDCARNPRSSDGCPVAATHHHDVVVVPADHQILADLQAQDLRDHKLVAFHYLVLSAGDLDHGEALLARLRADHLPLL